MNYYVYLLISSNIDKSITYVGLTNNLKKRLSTHNKGKGAKFTRGRKWKMIYKLKCKNKSIALKQEFKLKKNYKLRNQIKNKYLINEISKKRN